MMNVYEPDSRKIEFEGSREEHADRSISTIAQRMVRETELFLSYALTDGRNRRWIMLGERMKAEG